MLESFLKKTNNTVIIDANLFLLFLIGYTDIKLIETFNRTKMFTITDYNLLVNILVNNYNKLIITPNILTEVSNLVGQISELHDTV